MNTKKTSGKIIYDVYKLDNKIVYELAKKEGLINEYNDNFIWKIKDCWIKTIFKYNDKKETTINETFNNFIIIFNNWLKDQNN
jgi:predicted nucleotidyltransferase component of viral defense system